MTPELAAEMMGMRNFPEGWSFEEIRRNGQLAGWVSIKGAEVHCFRVDDFAGKWLTRQDVARILGPVMKKYGHVLTKVRRQNLCGHEFVKRLGFVPATDDGAHIHYRAERLKHARL